MKKYKKISISFLMVCAILLFSKKALAAGTYTEEGVAFYAQSSSAGLAIEGIAFYANNSQTSDTFPVYRFLNVVKGNHFYTISENEKDAIQNFNQSEYKYEGISFYSENTQTAENTPVYRFRNSITGFHFYTASDDEKNSISNNPQWNYEYEGIAFFTHSSQTANTSAVYRFINPKNGDRFYTASEDEKNNISVTPIYRLYNQNNGDHFYTASENEKDITANSSKSNYVSEGVAYYAHSSQISGTIPVYRFYNSSNGLHFYTSFNDEKNALINNSQSGYGYEGVAFYALDTKLANYNPVYRFANSTTGDHFYTISESERYALLNPPIGPDISVGLWGYAKSAIQSSAFQIDANKPYNIRDNSGNIIAKVSANSTTKVTYDADGNLKVYNSIADTLVATSVTFDATDGDNSNLVFNTHRSNYISDWRGKIDHYRGKIKVQYYHGVDIAGGTPDILQQVWIINILPLEQYAWGSAETDGSGNINHTRVMSTIFRTYGFWYIKYANKYSAYGYKIRSDSGSQNYGGYDWETANPNVKLATQNTRAVIATYGNDVALTPYSSWSDGRTRSWQEKWGGTDYPWCQSVSDPYGVNVAKSGGSHMVGLIGWGSVAMANQGWDWQRIMHYYYTGIDLTTNY